MNIKFIGMFLLSALLVFTFVGVAQARGLTPDTLTNAGWICAVAGPNGWIHCFPSGDFASFASMTVRVFDGADFLGTETLIRSDLYGGQPCATDGGGLYHELPSSETPFPVDFMACHHFDTSH